MKWAIEVQRTKLQRRNLSDLLAGIGFTLIDGIEYPAFTSPDIELCNTAEEAFDLAKRVRDVFTGASQIDPELTLGSVIDYSTNPPNRRAFLESHTGLLSITGLAPTLSISSPAGMSAIDAKKWELARKEQEYQSKLEEQRAKLEPAFINQRAEKLLELLSAKEPNGETLYKGYELAEGHPNNRPEFHATFGITKVEFSRFKDAVHNPSVSGDWARHAYPEIPKSSNPMSKSEAETFVRKIASEWLAYVRKYRIS